MCSYDNVYLNSSVLSRTMKSSVAFLAVSALLVALMYAVPYGLLNGLQGWPTFAFWTAASFAYLIIVIVFMRRRR